MDAITKSVYSTIAEGFMETLSFKEYYLFEGIRREDKRLEISGICHEKNIIRKESEFFHS